MAIKFNSPTKHGRYEFLPGVALAFEDKDAEPYFIAAGFAAKTSEQPVKTYSQGEVDIDPETVFGSGEKTGQRVMAKAASTGKGK